MTSSSALNKQNILICYDVDVKGALLNNEVEHPTVNALATLKFFFSDQLMGL